MKVRRPGGGPELSSTTRFGQGGEVLRRPRYRGRAVRNVRVENLTEALTALSADELRTFVTDALDRLDEGPRADLEDLLIQRASRSTSGWKPAAPTEAVITEARAFADAARRVGQAEPSEADRYLRHALAASLAGNHVSAREVFEALLEPIGNGDIHLGQHEMADEVLSVDLHECLRHYAAAVYVTTPLDGRPDALIEALDAVEGLGALNDPLAEIEETFGGGLPDLKGFVPRWISRLERDAPTGELWESTHERWLRLAIGRWEGSPGLARMARETKRVVAASAWCDALVAAGDWAQALRAFEECAALVGDEDARGGFLDGAALAAQRLGREDVAERLAAAWRGAPSLPRLLRWLLSDAPTSATVHARAGTALAECPTQAHTLIGLLRVLTGKVAEAAQLLAKAPGLGWSRSEHPGPVLFSAFAWMLGGTAPSPDQEEPQSPAMSGPPLLAPTLEDVLLHTEGADSVSPSDREAMLDAMKAAALRRTEAVLDKKRRAHYAHAAALVACCMLNEGTDTDAPPPWFETLRTRTARFPAFRRALHAALHEARRLSSGRGGPSRRGMQRPEPG